MANNSKIKAKSGKAGVPGPKASVSFTKRQMGNTHSEKAARSLSDDTAAGPRKAGRIGSVVGDDGAGTRSVVGLPPQTEAMAAPTAELPAMAQGMKSPTPALPGCDAKPINAIWGYEYERDMKLGAASRKSDTGGKGPSGANQG